METSHTPGPWKQHATPGKIYASVRGADGRCVADCGSRSDVIAQANAEFIVRACNAHDDLLEALQRAELSTKQICLAANIGHTSIKDKLRWYESQLEQLGRELRAAIDKAEGE